LDIFTTFLFVVSAIGLLGSPGPAIACLLAVGRAETVPVGLRYLTGLLIGLATAAAVCAAGIVSSREALPSLFTTLSVVAGIYLIYLSYKIATAPVGAVRAERRLPSTFWHGMIVGLSNPKAYVVFISLYASYILFQDSEFTDNLVKWLLTVAVMIAVDTAWLFVGVSLEKVNFNEQFERIMNYTLGAMVLVTTFLALKSEFIDLLFGYGQSV
jgi:threonine/homoserine/homoserine lactone efflux protein